MSKHSAAPSDRMTVPRFAAAKGGTPLVCLTAYTWPMAMALDPHCDLLLVGDSLAMVVYGEPDTLEIDLDTMIRHARAVRRGAARALVVVDIPFRSGYQESPEAAFRVCSRVMAETHCDAIKLEGGEELAPSIEFLVRRGIPVMAHVGLMPQRANSYGGFSARGRDDAEAERILADARAVAEAGAFSVVLEATAEPLARRITGELHIPTIGIGASPACDGQVLVVDDMLGLNTGMKPRFVKHFADMAGFVDQAAAAYAEEVRARRFPALEHCYGVKS